MRLACLLWLLFVAVYDFRQRRVPNWLVLAGAAVALAALALGTQPFGIEWSTALTGAAVGFGALLLLYAVGLMGAGDVKFAGALGLWVGLQALLPIWVVASLLAGLHSALWLALQRWPVAPRLSLMLLGRSSATSNGAAPTTARKRIVPYAAYLSLATAAWMVWGRQS
ncbi:MULTISPECIES: A24 family peptidase [unclassified Variovorax]|jgi:prepilin peptidase CpaA|uniref:A24 family peptidase n=1 Tax=unclassified Variovorax TaxID=663243 RepID=UPI000D134C3B|nr:MULTISPECIES: A24 family peptidase [unclassified Variovorax]AVQ83659.1 peptidase A24 [Variovorax sp. PMC12]QRY32019.1 prepilin peptidase [Variovorax sp. PDNC026]